MKSIKHHYTLLGCCDQAAFFCILGSYIIELDITSHSGLYISIINNDIHSLIKIIFLS